MQSQPLQKGTVFIKITFFCRKVGSIRKCVNRQSRLSFIICIKKTWYFKLQKTSLSGIDPAVIQICSDLKLFSLKDLEPYFSPKAMTSLVNKILKKNNFLKNNRNDSQRINIKFKSEFISILTEKYY